MELNGLQKILEIFAFFLTWTSVRGRLITEPENRVAVVGEKIHFNCSTDQPYSIAWQHVRTGRKTADDVYLSRRVVLPYHPRVTVEKIAIGSNVTHYDLVISSVKMEDAGTFRCRDEAGQGQLESAQLTVLEALPNCTTNIDADGLIGDNDCGIDTETIRCSCQLKYAGNIAPEMRWKTSQGNTLRTTDDITTNTSVSSDLQLKAAVTLNAAALVWYSARSPHNNWTSNKIKILHAKSNLSTVVINRKESVSCLANSSEDCSYRWIARFAPNYEPMLFEERNLSVDTPGTYFCEAMCMLKDVSCIIISLHTEFNYPLAVSLVENVSILGLWLRLCCKLLKCHNKARRNDLFTVILVVVLENRNDTAKLVGILAAAGIIIVILFVLFVATFARYRKATKKLTEIEKQERACLQPKALLSTKQC